MKIKTQVEKDFFGNLINPSPERKQRRENFLTLTLMSASIVLAVIVLFFLIVYFLVIKTKIISNSKTYIVILVLISSLILGYIFSFFISRVMFHPVNKYIDAMNQLSEGNYNVKLSFKSPIGRFFTAMGLTDSFNKMTSELSKSEMLNKDFINNLSHEIKTPIVSIAGFAKLLQNGNLSEENQKEYIDIIAEESKRLSTMTTKILNLLKVENQEILSNITKFNLSEQIRNSILLLESKWSIKDLDFSLDFDEFYIYANEELLKEVWINLLDNAIKFSPYGGIITINIHSRNKKLSVSITNNGSTIPVQSRERIFNKFYQADESHSSEGNGIGLSIVKKIVELHHGNVLVDSKDQTTTFSIILPK